MKDKQRHSPAFGRNEGCFKIVEELRKAILSGELKANTPIITERKLAKLYNVNHFTARKATQILVEEGLLEKHPGSGVFVKDPNHARCKKVGLCVPTLSISEYSDMVESVEEILFKNGYQFVLLRRDKEKEKAEKLAIVKKYLKIYPLDALLFASCPTEQEIEMLAKDYPNTKLAIIENDLSMRGIDSFYSDYETGAFFAAEHLCKQGAKNILHIAGPQDTTSAQLRRQGYERAMATRGLPTFVEVSENFLVAGGFKVMRQVLASGRVPDAVFAVNDLCALGAIKALLHAGIRVPENVKIVGMNNLREGTDNHPSLSTVDTKIDKTVKMAVEMILARLSSKANDDVINCMLSPHLIIRESSTAKLKTEKHFVKTKEKSMAY